MKSLPTSQESLDDYRDAATTPEPIYVEYNQLEDVAKRVMAAKVKLRHTHWPTRWRFRSCS